MLKLNYLLKNFIKRGNNNGRNKKSIRTKDIEDLKAPILAYRLPNRERLFNRRINDSVVNLNIEINEDSLIYNIFWQGG